MAKWRDIMPLCIWQHVQSKSRIICFARSASIGEPWPSTEQHDAWRMKKHGGRTLPSRRFEVLPVRPWKVTFPIGKDCLPTTSFQWKLFGLSKVKLWDISIQLPFHNQHESVLKSQYSERCAECTKCMIVVPFWSVETSFATKVHHILVIIPLWKTPKSHHKSTSLLRTKRECVILNDLQNTIKKKTLIFTNQPLTRPEAGPVLRPMQTTFPRQGLCKSSARIQCQKWNSHTQLEIHLERFTWKFPLSRKRSWISKWIVLLTKGFYEILSKTQKQPSLSQRHKLP